MLSFILQLIDDKAALSRIAKQGKAYVKKTEKRSVNVASKIASFYKETSKAKSTSKRASS